MWKIENKQREEELPPCGMADDMRLLCEDDSQYFESILAFLFFSYNLIYMKQSERFYRCLLLTLVLCSLLPHEGKTSQSSDEGLPKVGWIKLGFLSFVLSLYILLFFFSNLTFSICFTILPTLESTFTHNK